MKTIFLFALCFMLTLSTSMGRSLRRRVLTTRTPPSQRPVPTEATENPSTPSVDTAEVLGGVTIETPSPFPDLGTDDAFGEIDGGPPPIPDRPVYPLIKKEKIETMAVVNCEALKMAFGGKLGDCLEEAGFIYWRNDELLSWDKAREKCQTIAGGDLVSVHGTKERILTQQLSYSPIHNLGKFAGLGSKVKSANVAWIGLRRDNGPGCFESFKWADGTPFDYDYWSRGSGTVTEPNCWNGIEDCGVTWHFTENNLLINGWNDYACSNGYPSICKASGATETSPTLIVDPPETFGDDTTDSVNSVVDPDDAV